VIFFLIVHFFIEKSPSLFIFGLECVYTLRQCWI